MIRWRFWEKPEPSIDIELEIHFRWEHDIAKLGFRHWLYDQPPRGMWVEVSRREWPVISVWFVDDVQPQINIANLWWRPAKTADANNIIELVPCSIDGKDQLQIAAQGWR
jgi:hypothetical protein